MGKIILIVVLVLIGLLAVAFFSNQITGVEFEGNEYYTDEELTDLVISDSLEHNALYLYWEYNYGSGKTIPFIDTLEVELTGLGKVKITVYEKGIVGMVEYLDSYVYFDKDGVLVESSRKKIEEVPQITGLSFSELALHEKLPVEDPEVFNSILTLTQMLRKNEIWPDKISFHNSGEVSLTFGEVRVLLGTDNAYEEKITRLRYLMPDLQGRKGVLHMENFNEETKNITMDAE